MSCGGNHRCKKNRIRLVTRAGSRAERNITVTSTGPAAPRPQLYEESPQYKERLKEALRLDHKLFIRQITPPRWQFWRSMPNEAHGMAVLAGNDMQLAAQMRGISPNWFQSHLRQAPDHILLPTLIEAIDELKAEGIQIGQPFFSRAPNLSGTDDIPKPYGLLSFTHRAH
jgi:hypothetical protein